MKKNLLGIVGALAVVLAGCVQVDVAARGGCRKPAHEADCGREEQ